LLLAAEFPQVGEVSHELGKDKCRRDDKHKAGVQAED
jgi:hypothetical protein